MNYRFHGLRSLKIFKVSEALPSQRSSKNEFIDWLILLSKVIYPSVRRGQGKGCSRGSFCLCTMSDIGGKKFPLVCTSERMNTTSIKLALPRGPEGTQFLLPAARDCVASEQRSCPASLGHAEVARATSWFGIVVPRGRGRPSLSQYLQGGLSLSLSVLLPPSRFSPFLM